MRFCLFADVAPSFIQLDPGDVQSPHQSVVDLIAAETDTHTKAHNGVAVDASEAFGGADTDAFSQGTDDFDLPVERKVVRHGANPGVVARSWL
jgi:hypothetical protein